MATPAGNGDIASVGGSDTNMVMGGSEPQNFRVHATDNGRGKSFSNAGPTAANKRGVEPSLTMKDSLGLAKDVTPIPVK